VNELMLTGFQGGVASGPYLERASCHAFIDRLLLSVTVEEDQGY